MNQLIQIFDSSILFILEMNSGIQSIADFTAETKPTTGDIPPPLVGAATAVVGNSLYVFGGRLVSSRQMTNHLYILDLETLSWSRHIAEPDSPPPPRPRYFHSMNLYGKYLIVFGGMSYLNKRSSQSLCALDDVCLFDLELMVWKYPDVLPSIYKPQARYAHLSVCSAGKLIIMGGQDMSNQYIDEANVLCLDTFQWVTGGVLKKQYGVYRSVAFCPEDSDAKLITETPFWAKDMNEDMPTICVYSNHNFADVTRDLQSFSFPISDFKDHSAEMSGVSLPPGLRFPCGYLIGHHMVMTGTYLTPTLKAFNIWALNLTNLVWVRIDVGSVLAQGSWNKGVLYENKNQFIIFGDRNRDLLEDYSHRQVNYNHIAIVDLEAFGICTIPKETSAPVAQELGLSMLNEPSMADMEIITDDNRSIPVNSGVIKLRWPYFATLLSEKGEAASGFKRMRMPEIYAVALAFVQYLYTDHLMTAQQHRPNILSRLLLLSDVYHLQRLGDLATHALHQALTISTASMIYEVSAMTGRTALQIRSLRVMVNAKKMMQQQQQQYNGHQATSPLLDSPSLFAMHYSTSSQPQPSNQKRPIDGSSSPPGPSSPNSPTNPRWIAASKSFTTSTSNPNNSFYTTPTLKASKSSTSYYASRKVPPSIERPRKASLSPFSVPYGDKSTGMMSPTYEGSSSKLRF